MSLLWANLLRANLLQANLLEIGLALEDLLQENVISDDIGGRHAMPQGLHHEIKHLIEDVAVFS